MLASYLHKNKIEVGCDEAGRGCLAGPVVAAAVILPKNFKHLLLNDSKQLSEKKRVLLRTEIKEHAIAYAIGIVDHQEIDEINILQASLVAMSDAFNALDKRFKHALVDGNKLPQLPCSATYVIKGDGKSVSIAAASIVAKVTRDRIMADLHAQHPQYGWNTNSGYPSKAHREAIDLHGITPHHRKSFAPVRNFLLHGKTRSPIETAA